MSSLGHSQCQILSDFDDYQPTGMSSTIQWITVNHSEVNCFSSDWQPSFFVNQDTLLNVRITGEIFIPSSANDDDFVGFVFGYRSPNALTPDNDNHFYLFDWKRNSQHAPAEFGGLMAYEGFNLVSTSGIIDDDPVTTYKYFWAHQQNENFEVLDQKIGNTLGWKYNTHYQFELIYTYNKIQISIDGEQIFSLDGCFEPGLFGLYSFSQNRVTYRNIVIEQAYEINIEGIGGYFCEEREVSFSFMDTNCTYVPASLLDYQWYFGDGSAVSNELNPSHIYDDPGVYDVQLLLTNNEYCIDTIFKTVFIEAKASITQQPQDQSCYVGDQVGFSVQAENGESYQWYMKAQGASYWSIMSNNGYFSGVNTADLVVSNVRPHFDEMMFRCMVDGHCYNPVTSNGAQLTIIDIPVRAEVHTTDSRICAMDSSYLTITLKELYQVSQANLRIIYDTNAIQVTEVTTFFQNVDFEIHWQENYINIAMSIEDPLNINEAIVAAFDITAISTVSEPTIFSWDEEATFFIDFMGDTIYHFLYNTNILIHQAFTPEFNDTVNLCRGESIEIDPQLFYEVEWSNGDNGIEFSPSASGHYWVYIEDRNTCVSSDSFYLNLNDFPQPPTDIIWTKPFYCSAEEFIDFAVEGGKGHILKYAYNDIITFDSLNNQPYYHIPNPESGFNLEIAWKNACGTSNSIVENIEVYQNIDPSVTISSNQKNTVLGEKIVFEAISEHSGVKPIYSWFVEDLLKQDGIQNNYSTNELIHKQKLRVEMQSDEHCFNGDEIAFDEIIVNLQLGNDFYVPGIVTPDGDGINDSFKAVFRFANVYHFSLHIYDISGRLIYQTNSIYDYWNGKEAIKNGAFEIYTYRIKYSKKPNPIPEEVRVVSGKFLLNK